MDAAAVTAPDIEATLLAKEQQVQWEADDLVKALEDMNCKHEDLVNKRRDVQAMQEKHEVEQREVDAKVRGKLLANAVVAEVQCQFLCQANKVRLAAEKLQMEWEASQLLHKVQMKLGVSFFLFFFIA